MSKLFKKFYSAGVKEWAVFFIISLISLSLLLDLLCKIYLKGKRNLEVMSILIKTKRENS